MVVRNMDISREIVRNSRRTARREKKGMITQEVEELEKKKSKEEEVKYLYYD